MATRCDSWHACPIERKDKAAPNSPANLKKMRDVPGYESHNVHGFGEVACHLLTTPVVDQRRLNFCTNVLRLPAARAETAARRRVHRRRRIALQHDAVALPFLDRIRHRHG